MAASDPTTRRQRWKTSCAVNTNTVDRQRAQNFVRRLPTPPSCAPKPKAKEPRPPQRQPLNACANLAANQAGHSTSIPPQHWSLNPDCQMPPVTAPPNASSNNTARGRRAMLNGRMFHRRRQPARRSQISVVEIVQDARITQSRKICRDLACTARKSPVHGPASARRRAHQHPIGPELFAAPWTVLRARLLPTPTSPHQRHLRSDRPKHGAAAHCGASRSQSTSRESADWRTAS